MKKLSFAIIAMFTAMFVLGCNGEGGKPDASTPTKTIERSFSVGQMVRVGTNLPDLPKWVFTTSGIEGEKGSKVFYVVGKADGTNPNEAETSARANALGSIAEAVKVTVVKQFGEAWESAGKATSGDYERVRQGLIATKSEATFSGARQMASFVDQVAEVMEVTEDGDEVKRLSRTVYMAYVKVGISYRQYERLANGFIDDAKKSQPYNKRQKRLMGKLERTLRGFDNKSDYRLENKPEDEFTKEARTAKEPVVVDITIK